MSKAMLGASAAVLLLLLFGVSLNFPEGDAAVVAEQEAIFRSPSFDLGPGDVIDEYFQVEMPQGHIALRSYDAQVVDEYGVPVPLFETYLHHWVLLRYYIVEGSGAGGQGLSTAVQVSNSGGCQSSVLGQYFGLGSETRHTSTTIPPPFGIEVGDPQSIPSGFKEAWFLNVHAIDTRDAVNVQGCYECDCELYNVTTDAEGRELPAGYEGGLQCCYDDTHCAVRFGSEGRKRKLFMEYTVKWVEMTEEVVPVRIYILDVTDSRTSLEAKSKCVVEYTVEKSLDGANDFLHTKESAGFLDDGGDVVYAVAHQHSGGRGSTLYNENGAEICTSNPIYGQGKAAGNESGYIVGMTTCYPEPGTVRIESGEKLRLLSFYNNEIRHTGVMGLFYLLVADSRSPPDKSNMTVLVLLGGVVIIAAAVLVAVISKYQMMRRGGGPEYQSVN